MKFQHLILPVVLWLFVGVYISFFVPSSPLMVAGGITLITLATYFSTRVATHSNLTFIVTGGVLTFLLSSALSGFSLINLLLICAIAILLSQLINNPQTH